MNDSLRPFEGRGVDIVRLHKRVNRIAQLPSGRETGAPKCRTAQNAEPTLDLIQPGAVGGDEM